MRLCSLFLFLSHPTPPGGGFPAAARVLRMSVVMSIGEVRGRQGPKKRRRESQRAVIRYQWI